VFTSSVSGTISTARQWPDGIRTASPGTSLWARKVIIALSVCGAMPYWRRRHSPNGGVADGLYAGRSGLGDATHVRQ